MKKNGIIAKTVTDRPTPQQLAEAFRPWTPENDAILAAERKKKGSRPGRKKSARR